MVDKPIPFDMYTMLPRNKREFGVAMKAQGEAILSRAETVDKPLGFVVTAKYFKDTVGISDPVKAIELLWRSLPYNQFKIWLDGKTGAFMVETMPVAEASARKPSSIIMPGRVLNG